MTPLVNFDKTYKYKLDGKNMVTDSPHGTYRVDELNGNDLALFNYDASTVWYLHRE